MTRRMLRTLLLVVSVSAFGVTAGPAMGAMVSGTIGPPDCIADDCLGGHWTLEVTDVPLDAAYDVHVTLIAGIPSTGFVDDEGPIDPTHIVNVEFALPGDITGAVATNPLAMSFSIDAGPLGSAGCGDHNSNFLCAAGFAPIVLDSSLAWEWDVMVSDVGAIFDPDNWDSFHLGANLDRLTTGPVLLTALSGDKTSGWLVSVNPIPEPNAAIVFAAGALVVGVAIRKKLR